VCVCAQGGGWAGGGWGGLSGYGTWHLMQYCDPLPAPATRASAQPNRLHPLIPLPLLPPVAGGRARLLLVPGRGPVPGCGPEEGQERRRAAAAAEAPGAAQGGEGGVGDDAAAASGRLPLWMVLCSE